MVGWTLQWNAYDPGFVGTANVADFFGVNGPESNDPSSAVTVCGSRSLLTSVRVEPAAAVIGGNLYPSTTTCSAAAEDAAPDADAVTLGATAVVEPVEPLEELLPQDVSSRARPAAIESAR